MFFETVDGITNNLVPCLRGIHGSSHVEKNPKQNVLTAEEMGKNDCSNKAISFFSKGFFSRRFFNEIQ